MCTSMFCGNEKNPVFNYILAKHKDYLIVLCQLNDSIGKPHKYEFKGFTHCSPSNIRYIYHSLIILHYIKQLNLNNLDLIEIGGGYGGLCFFLSNISKLFGISFNSYTMFDLHEPSQLQHKYLSNLKLGDVKCVTIDNYVNVGLQKDSFLVSTYSFSEIPMSAQHEYTSKILNTYVSHGFIAWNNIDVYEFIENKEICVEEEKPKSSFTKNCFVRF